MTMPPPGLGGPVDVILFIEQSETESADAVARILIEKEVEVRIELAIDVSSPESIDRNSAGAIAVLIGRTESPSGLLALANLTARSLPTHIVLVPGADREFLQSVGLRPDDSRIQIIDATAGFDYVAIRPLVAFAGYARQFNAQSPDNAQNSAPTRRAAATKQAPPLSKAPSRSDEAGAPAVDLDPEIFRRLSPSSKRALEEAARLVTLAGSSKIHTDHLLVGLYRKQGGPTQKLLNAAGISAEDLGTLLEDVGEAVDTPNAPDPPPLTEPPAVSRHVRDAFLAARDIADQHPLVHGAPAPIQSRHLLYGALSVTDCTPVQALIDRGVRREDIVMVDPPVTSSNGRAAMAGYQSDSVEGSDLLDIAREVEAIAKVIAARDVEPPLAIGLFGDWGTGKTFFMRELQDWIEAISNEERGRKEGQGQPFYKTEIVQLEFNAWHYIEQDLWASLTSAIFDGLDEALTKRGKLADALAEEETSRAKLFTDLAADREKLGRLSVEKEEANRRLQEIQVRLDGFDARADQIEREVRPGEIAARALAIATGEPELEKQITATKAKVDSTIGSVTSAVGIDAEKFTTKIETAGSPRSWIATTTREVFRGSRVWLPIALAAGFFFAVGIAIYAIAGSALAGVAAGVVGALVGALTPALYVVGRVWRVVSKARAQGLQLIDQKRQEQLGDLQNERASQESRAMKAEAEMIELKGSIEEKEKAIAATEPRRALATFVSGRRASTDYRNRLGTISKARSDFEQLSRLLIRAQLGGNGHKPSTAANVDPTALDQQEFLPNIERIVLYIDDLDRCSEKEVVDVLQAVHLLLAFPLFVVVVAVDPRWLVHSLRIRARALQGPAIDDAERERLTDAEAEAAWEATPLNYLEKIFQVPFVIKPMGEGGYTAMIDELVKDKQPSQTDPDETSNGTEPQPGARDADAAAAATNGKSADTTPISPPDGKTAQPTHATTSATQPVVVVPLRKVDLDPGFLRISDPEKQFMKELHPLIATPRSTKRFVNVYRILKASATSERQSQLDSPDQHRAVLTLLAMLTSHPTEATVVLRELVEHASANEDWWEFADKVCKAAVDPEEAESAEIRIRNDRWRLLQRQLVQLQSVYHDATCAPFMAWAQAVARFSFEASRVVFAEADKSAASGPDAKVTNARNGKSATRRRAARQPSVPAVAKPG